MLYSIIIDILLSFEKKEENGRKDMNLRDWLFWLINSGVIIGIIGSIILNQEVIIIGLILGIGGLFSDSYLERKEELQKQS